MVKIEIVEIKDMERWVEILIDKFGGNHTLFKIQEKIQDEKIQNS